MSESIATLATYAGWRASLLGSITERLEIDAIFALAGRLAGQSVLDVGTGDGSYAIEAAARGAQVTALDVEQPMLDRAATRARERGESIDLRQGRVEALPFDDDSFDLVLAVTVLCFVPDARAALREIARVLAPGGRLVLGELGRYSLWAAERRVRGWLGSQTWRSARFWSRAELVKLVRAAGLDVSAVRGSVFYPPSALAALAVGRFEPVLARIHAPGAAFLAVAADAPKVVTLRSSRDGLARSRR